MHIFLKDNYRKTVFWGLNLSVAILLYLILYCVLSSDYFLSGIVRQLYGPGRSTVFGHEIIPKSLFRFVALHGKDFILGYLLVFAMLYWYRGEPARMRTAAAIVLGFEIVLALWLIIFRKDASFSLDSFITELIGNALALVVIMIHERMCIR